jgi:hypothetical protein
LYANRWRGQNTNLDLHISSHDISIPAIYTAAMPEYRSTNILLYYTKLASGVQDSGEFADILIKYVRFSDSCNSDFNQKP